MRDIIFHLGKSQSLIKHSMGWGRGALCSISLLLGVLTMATSMEEDGAMSVVRINIHNQFRHVDGPGDCHRA